jgi:tetraprenyl-beta-curcumene synthase
MESCIIDDMAGQVWGRAVAREATVALVRANARFWPTVFPDVRRELREWDRCAHAIPDPALRSQALAKLQHERFNTEVAATLATLVPPVRRRDATEAIVALEVMYDYLDGLGEQSLHDPLADGRQLYRALADAVAPAGPLPDYYRHHPHCDDGGYLAALVSTCRRALWSLPAAPVVAPAAQAVLARCGEAQTRTHAVAHLGSEQLRAWASCQPEVGRLRWPEVAAGATASVLAGHALVALAADPATTAAEAQDVVAAYHTTCALTTLLDGLMDAEADAVGGNHSYLAYYASEAEAAERLVTLARDAVAAVERLPRAAHHLMTVAGALAFYLSAPEARAGRARRLTEPITRELRPLLAPPLAIFAAWRGVKRRRAPRAAARTSTPAVAALRRACVVSRDAPGRLSPASASRSRPRPVSVVAARRPRRSAEA